MAKKDNGIEAELLHKDITLIKRISIAMVVIVGMTAALVAWISWQGGQAQKASDEIENYTSKHRDEVRKLFETDEALTFDRLAFGWRPLEGEAELAYELSVQVLADKSRPITEHQEKCEQIKKELDKILTNPPRAAKVRLVVRSELLYE